MKRLAWVAVFVTCTDPSVQDRGLSPPIPASSRASIRLAGDDLCWAVSPRLQGPPTPWRTLMALDPLPHGPPETSLEATEPDSRGELPEASPEDSSEGRSPLLVIGPYDDLIRESASGQGLDWLLLAALVLHESGFNPCLASSAGAVGLAQVMPETAEELGVRDPWDPAQSIEAGARYLRRMYDVFKGVEEIDRVAFALASYTAGLGHVLDACSLAAVDGRDPRKWAGNVEETLAQLTNPEFAQRATRGRARGHQAVAFVNRVLQSWSAYVALCESLESLPPSPRCEPGSTGVTGSPPEG